MGESTEREPDAADWDADEIVARIDRLPSTSLHRLSCGNIAEIAPHIEASPRRAAGITAGRELFRQFCPRDAGTDGTVLQRSRIVVEPSELREFRLCLSEEVADGRDARRVDIIDNAARYNDVAHQPMPNAASAARSGHQLRGHWLEPRDDDRLAR